MKNLYILLLALPIMLVSTVSQAQLSHDYSNTIKLFKASPQVRGFFDNAYGYAVFPKVGKGAFIVGGAYGEGKVYRGGQVTGITSLIHISVGLQAGGQGFSQIIFLQDKRAFDEFTSGRFEFGADASAIAVTVGAQAQVGSKGSSAGLSSGPSTGKQAQIRYTKGMAVFVQARGGFMIEAAIGGQKFNYKPL